MTDINTPEELEEALQQVGEEELYKDISPSDLHWVRAVYFFDNGDPAPLSGLLGTIKDCPEGIPLLFKESLEGKRPNLKAAVKFKGSVEERWSIAMYAIKRKYAEKTVRDGMEDWVGFARQSDRSSWLKEIHDKRAAHDAEVLGVSKSSYDKLLAHIRKKITIFPRL